MTSQSLVGAAFLMTMSVAACDRGLTHDEAKIVIETNPLIRPNDNVSVDAISPTSSAEAVVRATIGGQTTNLKFRRFDKGWTWEFVETKSGGWIAPDVAIGQIREEHRAVAAAGWADQNKTAYAATAKTMYLITLYKVPNPTQLLNLEAWMRFNRLLAEMLKKKPNDQDRLAVLTNDHSADAWGNEIETKFDSNNNSALVLSLGSDKVRGTDDDLLCLNTFRRDVEDGRMVWAHDRTWTLPEGLDGVIEPFFDKRTDRVESTKVVKP